MDLSRMTIKIGQRYRFTGSSSRSFVGEITATSGEKIACLIILQSDGWYDGPGQRYNVEDLSRSYCEYLPGQDKPVD